MILTHRFHILQSRESARKNTSLLCHSKVGTFNKPHIQLTLLALYRVRILCILESYQCHDIYDIII